MARVSWLFLHIISCYPAPFGYSGGISFWCNEEHADAQYCFQLHSSGRVNVLVSQAISLNWVILNSNSGTPLWWLRWGMLIFVPSFLYFHIHSLWKRGVGCFDLSGMTFCNIFELELHLSVSPWPLRAKHMYMVLVPLLLIFLWFPIPLKLYNYVLFLFSFLFSDSSFLPSSG